MQELADKALVAFIKIVAQEAKVKGYTPSFQTASEVFQAPLQIPVRNSSCEGQTNAFFASRIVAELRRANDLNAYARHLGRPKIGQIYLYRRNFIGGLYTASEIFLTPRKTTV